MLGTIAGRLVRGDGAVQNYGGDNFGSMQLEMRSSGHLLWGDGPVRC